MKNKVMKEKIILLGCGGHAKSIVDAIEAAGIFEIAGFVDNVAQKEFEYRGYKVIGCDDQLQEIYSSGIHYAFVSVGFLGRGRVRNKLYKQLKKIGFTLPTIIDPTAVLAVDVNIGEGTFVGKKAVINSNALIGKMAIINTATVIEHDSVIDDFCHLAISSVICGMVHVGENTFVGANVTVIQGVNIGANAVLGAGTVVVKDIPSSCTVVGVPGKVIKYHEEG